MSFARRLSPADRDMAGEDDDRRVMALGQVELDRGIAVQAHVPDIDRREGSGRPVRPSKVTRQRQAMAGVA